MLLIYLCLVDEEEQKSKFERLYNTYRKIMLYTAKRILKDESLAEDAVHQSFLKIAVVIKKIEEKPCHKTRGLMVLIVENTAKDIYNKRKRENIVPDEVLDAYADDTIFEEVVSRVEAHEIAEKIKLLPDLYKQAFVLRYIQNYTDIEVAKMLGISHAAVRKRLERARGKLQEMLREEK